MSDCLTEEPRIESHLSPYEAVEVNSCVDAAIAQKPSLYYGWIMLPLAMAALVASSPGQTFGVSILNEPMRESLQLTHGQLAAAYTFGTMLGALPITFVGTLMDRYGMRRTMLAAVSFLALACGLTAIVQGWAMLVIAFFTLRSLGPGTLAFLSGNTLAFWFDRRLGMVEGLWQLGMAVAMAFVPTLNLWLVAHFGWRGAYAWLGTGVWLTLFPLLWLFFRDRPEHVGQEIDGGTRVGRAASVGASDGHLWDQLWARRCERRPFGSSPSARPFTARFIPAFSSVWSRYSRNIRSPLPMPRRR